MTGTPTKPADHETAPTNHEAMSKAAYNRDSFIFYASFFRAIDVCPIENQRNIYRAIAAYALTGEMPELNGIERAVFLMAQPQIDSNTRRYLNGQKGAEHGKKGGAPKGNQNARKKRGFTSAWENEQRERNNTEEDEWKPKKRGFTSAWDNYQKKLREQEEQSGEQNQQPQE